METREIKCKWIEIDGNGKKLKEKRLDLSVCIGDEPPILEIDLDSLYIHTKEERHRSISIPLYELAYKLDKIRHGKEEELAAED